MARKPTSRVEYVLFDVTYEDGTLRSNRRVPRDILDGLDGDDPAKPFLEAQDRDIADRSGRPIVEIASLHRSPKVLAAAPDRAPGR